jgi:uncharacterized protein YuzE
MKINYDKETDALYIRFLPDTVKESDQDKSGIIIDYSEKGTVVGIELLNASKYMPQPNVVTYEVA